MPLPLVGLGAIGSIGGALSQGLRSVPVIGGLARRLQTPAQRNAERRRKIESQVARVRAGDLSALQELESQTFARHALTNESRAAAQALRAELGGGARYAGPGGGGGDGGVNLGDIARFGLGAIGAIQGAQSAGRAEQAFRRGTQDPGNPYTGLAPVYRGGGRAVRAAQSSLGF